MCLLLNLFALEIFIKFYHYFWLHQASCDSEYTNFGAV